MACLAWQASSITNRTQHHIYISSITYRGTLRQFSSRGTPGQATPLHLWRARAPTTACRVLPPPPQTAPAPFLHIYHGQLWTEDSEASVWPPQAAASHPIVFARRQPAWLGRRGKEHSAPRKPMPTPPTPDPTVHQWPVAELPAVPVAAKGPRPPPQRAQLGAVLMPTHNKRPILPINPPAKEIGQAALRQPGLVVPVSAAL